MSVSLTGSAGGSSASALSQWRQQLFQKIDADGSGGIDKSEFEIGLKAKGLDASKADELFARLDKDGDGSVSEAELAKGMRRAHHHRRAEGAQDSAASSSGSSTSLTDLFAQIDGDGDGSVSKAEFEAFGQKLSSQMTGTLLAGQDAGGDGFGFGPPPPPPSSGAQAYGQVAAWGGASGDRQQDAAGVLLQQMLSAFTA